MVGNHSNFRKYWFYAKQLSKQVLFIYLFIYLFTYLLTYFFVYLFIYLFIYFFLLTYLFVYLFIYLLIYWFIYLFIYLFIYCWQLQTITEQILFTMKNSNKMLIDVNTLIKKPVEHKTFYKRNMKMKYF